MPKISSCSPFKTYRKDSCFSIVHLRLQMNCPSSCPSNEIQILILLQNYLQIPKHQGPVHTLMNVYLYGFHTSPLSAPIQSLPNSSLKRFAILQVESHVSSLSHLMSSEPRISSWCLHFEHGK